MSGSNERLGHKPAAAWVGWSLGRFLGSFWALRAEQIALQSRSSSVFASSLSANEHYGLVFQFNLVCGTDHRLESLSIIKDLLVMAHNLSEQCGKVIEFVQVTLSKVFLDSQRSGLVNFHPLQLICTFFCPLSIEFGGAFISSFSALPLLLKVELRCRQRVIENH